LSEKKTKVERLRACSRQLQELALERIPSLQEWDAATEDLTQDDFEHLRKIARGHLERALEAVADQEPRDALEEARSAVLLWPRDSHWAQEVATTLRSGGWTGVEAEGFYTLLDRRRGKKRSPRVPRWFLPGVVLVVALALGVWVAIQWGPSLGWGHSPNPIQGPRGLEVSFDTQGVKTNIQVVQSRMLIFPDATVAELSAWVTFPDHKVGVWEGTVRVLDAQGQALATRDVVFHGSNAGEVDPGQGVAVFEQFDAWPWYDRVASFQVVTTRIQAKEAKPGVREALPLAGIDSLTEGYGLKVWVNDLHWMNRFASAVASLSLELENTGLKPFQDLELELDWKDSLGKTLKTFVFHPVSEFRTTLPSGGKLGWTRETIFDTEIFQWAPGAEPHPVLELKRWK